MTATRQVIEVLGGARVFHRRVVSARQLHEQIRAGLPYKSLESVLQKLRLSLADVVVVLHVPPRTLARRKQARKLPAEESDRLYRLARIGAQATDVLGSEDKAATWLRRPNRALNNQAPLKLLDTEVGTRQVEEVLGRIEHGIVS